jgi:hypothetical protein
MYVIIQWLLRADVERTSLLADEALLTSFLHHDKPLSELPEELAGVNLEVALAECFERMETAGAYCLDGFLNFL